MKRTTVSVGDEHHALLRALAAAQRRPVQQVAEDMMREGLKRHFGEHGELKAAVTQLVPELGKMLAAEGAAAGGQHRSSH